MAETKARFLADTQKADTTAEAFTWPTGRASQDNYVLAMTNTSTGETSWQVTATAPTITGITSGQLNSYYDVDGTTVSNDKGGTLVIAGTDFGTDISSISVRICASDGTSQVTATTLASLSDTSITATWNGTESGYSTFSGVYYVQIVKSGLTSSLFNSTKSFSGDPTISSVTGTGGEGDNVTVTSSNLGSYGGKIAGGGQDSNTKLLLNFDRTGGTDFEDSSNSGGNGHKITVNNEAIIKASPFGDGKSAIFFDGTNNYLSIPASSDLALGTGDFTIEAWVYSTDWSHASYINLFDFRNGDQDTDAFWLGFEGTEYFSTDGRLYMYHNGVRHLDSDNAVFPTNEWHHLAVTRVGATITAYVDGVATGTTYNIGSTTDLSGQNPVYIGRYFSSDTYHFKGYLDEIRIVKGSAVYTSNFTVPTSRLTAITNTKLLIHSDQSGGIGVGNRSGSITVTHSPSGLINSGSSGSFQQLVDGDTTTAAASIPWFSSGLSSGHLLFDFGVSQIVNKIKWIQNATNSQGQWTFSGSNDNLSFTALKTNFELASGLNTDNTFTNTTGYRYYKLEKTGTGTTSSSPYTQEIQFFNTAFTDSSASSHNITATGAFHSAGHGGIAPAMTFPASLKKTGSAGVYFDGTTDYLETTNWTGLGSGKFTIDFWLKFDRADSTGPYIPIMGNVQSSAGYFNINLKKVGDQHNFYVYENTTQHDSGHAIDDNQWHHCMVTRDSSNVLELWVDGTRRRTDAGITTNYNSTQNWRFGHDNQQTYYFKGYLDNIRIVVGEDMTSVSGDPVYSANGTTYTLPTKIYGAMYPTNPSVGTITITGSATNVTYDSNGENPVTTTADVAFSEINNSLPNGLTLTDGGASGATDPNGASVSAMTAHITGELTDVVGSDTTTNNIRIQAKANNDDKRITEVNESNSVGAVSITKKAGGEPVLFNARRYVGNQTNREINGFGFAPDFVWLKNRDTGINHCLFDSIRGATKQIDANTNGAETTQATMLTAFNKDGFSHGTDTAGNKTDDGHIAWGWKAGGAPSGDGKRKKSNSSTEESLSSGTDYNNITEVRQSVNVEGDFSITKYKGGNATSNNFFKHGLSGKPDWVIIKRLTSAHWVSWHSSGDSGNAGAGDWILLSEGRSWGTDENNNAQTYAFFGTNGITNEEIYLQNDQGWTNTNNTEFICYAWKAKANVSAFGTYSGATSAKSVTGLGFSPSFLIVKRINGTGDWYAYDKFRGVGASGTSTYTDSHSLALNSSEVERQYNGWHVAFDSDGFTFPDWNRSGVNNTGETYIYMAFA